MFAKIAAWYKGNAKVRFVVRTAVTAATAYGVSAVKNGHIDARSLIYGAAGAVFYALVGLVTPVEPKVGVKTEVTS